jgi:hypothetical protein
MQYARDFIVVKLRPACQFCKRYITGTHDMDVKYHCLACEKIPALPLTAHGYSNPYSKGKETQERESQGISTDLCRSCYEREKAAHEQRIAGAQHPIPGSWFHHAHPITAFVPIPVEAAPGLKPVADPSVVAPSNGAPTNGDVKPEISSALTVVAGAGRDTSSDALPRSIIAARAPELQLVDPDGLMDSQFFATRSMFLNLCQGNHYQFDTLRRAKHSSMMVMWHVHHPLAPSFVHSCNSVRNMF